MNQTQDNGTFGAASSQGEHNEDNSGIPQTMQENKINDVHDRSRHSQTPIAMESASDRIRKLRKEIDKTLQPNINEFLDELDMELLLSKDEYFTIDSKNDEKAKIRTLINIILMKEEKICERFLQLLQKDHSDKYKGGNTGISRDKTTLYRDLLKKMNMDPYETKKLTLQDILQINQECLQKTDDWQRESAAWNFIHKIIGLNETARNINSISKNESEDPQDDLDDITCDSSNSVHPLDVLCLVLHCCDHFLQQEIILKMSMCQFAVPLLLPDVDGPGCTFMLWGMREIVKTWRPQSLAETKGFVQSNLVQISMPTFSFVRLGKHSFHKSNILNQVLSPAQHTHDFFVHSNMEGGNVTREISEGLVEISWYFPAGKSKSDIFSEPVAFANLHGNLEENLKEFAFLTQISSAVFIFVQNIDQHLYDFLSQYENSQTNFVIIINKNVKTGKSTKLTNTTVLAISSEDSGAIKANRIRAAAAYFIKKECRVLSLENMSQTASKLGISVDENVTECQNAKADAKAITEEIKDVAEYKKKTMKLQGDLWRKLAKLGKEMCQIKQQGDKHGESYKLELQKQCAEIREKQYQCEMPNGISKFIDSIMKRSITENHYFFKWLRFYLDTSAMNNCSALKAEYQQKSNSPSMIELSGFNQKISDSSLGIEHFLREVGQIYEAEYFMLKGENARKRKFTQLPAFAADLLLGGFPLELIDGDASNIPLQWLQDVLHELDNKTGKCCRMGVITVLGVQSTGKSTLLNTMFGLQFPVSSGRCTRGAFMTLMKVRENFQGELGCEFILVIDTEGLRAPELTSLENSYEHDNELATLVAGLSDTVIVNMSMENTSEMKDILQIVVHAFLRMKEIGRKPNCHFVHQNVSDVSAHEKTRRDRLKLLEHLNEMTKLVANMEKKTIFTAFHDIMMYDQEKDSFYIPGLWNGVPPMASISTAYSETIFELKAYLIECMKNKGHRVLDFIEWIKSLWNAVKHENFIFSFRNSLVANAYNQLAKKYSEMEWKFTKTIHKWLVETETVIKNQNAQMVDSEGTKCINKVYSILSEEEKNMKEELEKYFSNDNKDASLVERYKAEFLTSVSCLRKKLESSSLNKCAEIIHIQKEILKIRNFISIFKEVIDKKVNNLVIKFREEKCKPNENTLEEEFELMWADTILELNVTALPELNIELNLLAQLKKEMASRGSSVNQRLNSVNQLPQQEKLHLHESHAICLLKHVKSLHILDSAAGDKLEEFLMSLSHKCSEYIKNKLHSKSDYNETYGMELLNLINSICKENKDLQISADIELELKLFILGNALCDFQNMHKEFAKKNDPVICLGEMKPKYCKCFQYLFQEKNEIWERAKHFCELWLKPALIKQVNRKIGYEIVDHILLDCSQSNQFSTRMYFQFTVMKYLLEKTNFSDYLEYICDYETFVKKWINNCIIEKCDFHHMQALILSNITKKIKVILNENSQKTSDFLVQLKERLKRDLVLSDDMDVFHLKEDTNIKEFVENLEKSLGDTEAKIISEMKAADKETILSNVVVKPVDELFKKVFGCGKQCPFCKAPCEAGGADHKSHFASIHRPTGLGKYRTLLTQDLCHEICSTNISGNKSFLHGSASSCPYKEYKTVYPDWEIPPDPSFEASDYWKYVIKTFNEQFAKEYEARPAEYPEEWNTITKAQAQSCLNTAFGIK
ncbi:interferon-induced very large GTPase 1 isoform X2 [Xenopus laevis]|nr:interferon-induced very large GTPase 1 isoform X2 [Xenopus laevis]